MFKKIELRPLISGFDFALLEVHTRILQYNDQVAETNEDILALWQKYFQDLSNPDFKQDFEK
jgi:hypothetical protein